jgi:glycosyltransferase involved in cell wall biosynthesis
MADDEIIPRGGRREEIAIVGLVRNCGSVIERNIQRLREAFASFDRIRWFVVESDSDDDTLERLAHAEREIDGFSYFSAGQLREQYPRRTERIAVCRNIYLDALGADDFSDVDYVAVADLDGVNDRLSRAAVDSCWAERTDWDGVFANQPDLYYDVWALRHPDWNPGDCWRQQRFLMQFALSPAQAEYAAIFAKMIAIPTSSPWLEVDSAFGGLGIYRRDALLRGRYVGIADDHEVCEHVHLHRLMRTAGTRLYINPQLVNGGANEHSAPALNYALQVREALPRRLVARGKWLGRRFLNEEVYSALKAGIQRVSHRRRASS